MCANLSATVNHGWEPGDSHVMPSNPRMPCRLVGEALSPCCKGAVAEILPHDQGGYTCDGDTFCLCCYRRLEPGSLRCIEEIDGDNRLRKLAFIRAERAHAIGDDEAFVKWGRTWMLLIAGDDPEQQSQDDLTDIMEADLDDVIGWMWG